MYFLLFLFIFFFRLPAIDLILNDFSVNLKTMNFLFYSQLRQYEEVCEVENKYGSEMIFRHISFQFVYSSYSFCSKLYETPLSFSYQVYISEHSRYKIFKKFLSDRFLRFIAVTIIFKYIKSLINAIGVTYQSSSILQTLLPKISHFQI